MDRGEEMPGWGGGRGALSGMTRRLVLKFANIFIPRDKIFAIISLR